jgi:hypothetical protein
MALFFASCVFASCNVHINLKNKGYFKNLKKEGKLDVILLLIYLNRRHFP